MKKILILITCFMTILLVNGSLYQSVDLKSQTILEKIKEDGRLTVLTSPDYPPFSFVNIDAGKERIVGFDVMIAEAIAQHLSVELVIKSTPFDSIIPSLAIGEGDLGISGFSPTAEREKTVDFSKLYYIGMNSILLNSEKASQIQSIEDLKNVRVGAQMGSIQQTLAEDLDLNNLKISQSLETLVLEVSSGTLDAVIITDSAAKSYLANMKNLVLAPFSLENNEEGVAVAIPKGNEDLKLEINRVIDQLTNEGKIDQLYHEAETIASEMTVTKATGLDFSVLNGKTAIFLKGAAITVAISFFTVLIGTVLGFIVSLWKLSKYRLLRLISSIYIAVIRGTPLLVQVFIIVFGLPQVGIRFPNLPGLANSSLIIGVVFALILNSSAYVAEIFRGGIQGIDRGLVEAARSLGLSRAQSMKYVILPLAIKQILPALGNEFVVIIKESSIVSVVGVADLMYAANIIKASSYRIFEPLIFVAIIYFILTYALSFLLKILEGRMSKYDSN